MAGITFGADDIQWKSREMITSDDGYNNAIYSGFYRVGAFESAGNNPTNGVLFVLKTTELVAFQIFVNYNGSVISRINWFGSWKGWKTIVS